MTILHSFRFKSLLTSSGLDGSPNKEIEICDIKYNIFKVKNNLNHKSVVNINHCTDLVLNITFNFFADDDVILLLWRDRIAEDQHA